MKKLLITFVCITFLACEQSYEIEYGHFISRGLALSVLNSEDKDMLDPKNKNSIDHSHIKLFYVVNGKKEEVYHPNYEHPRNFMIFKHPTNEFYRIGITLNETKDAHKSITYIQWNDSDIDTIEATYLRTKNSIVKNNIWLNGKHIWELKGDYNPHFVLKK